MLLVDALLQGKTIGLFYGADGCLSMNVKHSSALIDLKEVSIVGDSGKQKMVLSLECSDPNAHAGGSENLVACTEHSIEKLELLVEEFVDSLIGGVFPVQEIHNDHVELLPVAVTASDALLDALRISALAQKRQSLDAVR